MSPTIQIDDDVFEALKRHAEPFVDTPNDVIRRLASSVEPRAARNGANVAKGTDARTRRSSQGDERIAKGDGKHGTKDGKRRRAPSDQLLPKSEYELPILRVLDEAGGRLPTSEAIAEVRVVIEDKLMPMDLEMLDSGKPRWEMRVVFTRLRLIKAGWLNDDSPRGMWEISEAGRRHLAEHQVTA